MDGRAGYVRDVRTQAAGSYVTAVNKRELAKLYEKLYQIDHLDEQAKQEIMKRLDEALGCVDNVRTFVGSPEKILGSVATKHGEIAEHVDVEFQNAWDVMMGKVKSATFDNVGRTAPEDYIVNGVKVQSKYINGTSNSLSHVLEHLETYKDIGFGTDGSYYVIPKDQFQEIKRIMSGDTQGVSPKTVRAIEEKVRQIEQETGKSFFDVVKPGRVDYKDVQQGAIHKTLDREEENLRENAQEQTGAIEEESKKKREAAQERAKPSWKKAASAAAVSAGISGGLQLAFGIQRKCKQGKKIQEFTVEDWKEIGLDTTKATAEGGISGLAIYGMTNVTKIPAPIASAGVSFSFGLAELTHSYCCKKISKTEFIDGSQTICLNAIVCALGAMVGERLIPIPVLGSIIGSAIAGNIAKELLAQGLHDAIMNASEYVYGSTVSMLNAAKEINMNHKITENNLREIRQKNMENTQRIDEFYAQLGGLL